MPRIVANQLTIRYNIGWPGFGPREVLVMSTCIVLHFPDDVLEKYAMGSLSNLDCGPFEEHLPLCEDCRTRLMKVEEYILVVRAALTELEIHSNDRIGAQSVFAL
jgi:anti-sigma factor ChrR (cupin superfamily)